VELRLNGQLLFRYDQDAYTFTKLSEVISPFWPFLSYYVADKDTIIRGNTSRTHVFELNLARLRALVTESHLQNTPRFTNQTFQLNFTPEITNSNLFSNGLANPDPTKRKYSVVVTYCYNAVFLCGGDGGQSQLITA
jgi:hypothetical protein